MSNFYDDLALWWQLISPTTHYAEEAAMYLELLETITKRPDATLLELGSGGGNNAFYMKEAFSATTLVDLSEAMLDISRQQNPDCEHLPGDMRNLRLDRQFDAVFIHDAIEYMVTLDDLRQALETAFIHCKPGGMALFVPDHVRETFQEETSLEGEDGEGRALRYITWSYDPDPADSSITTDYVFVLHEDGQPRRVQHESHIYGLFGRDEWLALLRDVGFLAEIVWDEYERPVFVAHRP